MILNVIYMKNFLIILSLLFFFSNCSTKKEDPVKPNIIYIMADDLGYGEVGCYGQKDIKTPNIDRLAGEGIKFTQHYSGSPVCAPARSVLMTGLHTGHTPSRGNMEVDPYGQFPLPGETVTVAELLKKAGYKTAMYGKWGLGVENSSGDPNVQGFDDFYGYYCQVHAHNSFPEYLYHNGKKIMLDNEVHYLPEDHWTRGLGGYATEKVDYSNDDFFEMAIDFIANNREDPFFLYLPVTMPHDNGEAPEGERYESPTLEPYEAEEDWSFEKKSRASVISRMDDYVGLIMKELDKINISNNTILIFTSDNGCDNPDFFKGSGELRGMKRDVYEGGIRVPLIVRWPGKIEAGSVSDHISAFWDFLPTACEIADIELEIETDGISYLPELLGGPQPEHDYLYWEFQEQGKKQAVRKGNWKAVRLGVYENPDAPIELYDLGTDIGEQNNVAENYPEIVEEMDKIIKKAHVSDPNWPLYSNEFE
jgi:arylsulfatase A-like enzyme